MDKTKTPGDYAAQTKKWRDHFDPYNRMQYADQVQAANAWIEKIKVENPALYTEFAAGCTTFGPGGIGWVPLDWAKQREDELAEQQAPVSRALSGRHHDNFTYTALNMSTADGVLKVAMAHAFETGDVNFGYIISAHSNTKWRFDVTCVAYDPNAITPEEFLSRVQKGAPTEFKVNSDFVTKSTVTDIAYRKKGTCNVRFAFEGGTQVKASDSPQYNDGKERVPVHYKV